MPLQLLKIEPWGPPKLRDIVKEIQDAVNDRTPLASETVELQQQPDGVQICLKESGAIKGEDAEGGSGGGGSSGTPIDIYGALNGQPALFHLLQSSPPTPIA